MEAKNDQILKHIVSYCKQVQEAVSRFGDNYELFLDDNVYQNAVSMPIMQIGELTKKLTPEFRVGTEKDFHWREIAGMRDRYAHGYLDMDMNQVWRVASEDAPILQKQCEDLLEKARELEAQEAEEPEL